MDNDPSGGDAVGNEKGSAGRRPRPRRPTPKVQRRRRSVFVVLALVLAIAGAVGGYFLVESLTSDDSEATDESPSAAIVATPGSLDLEDGENEAVVQVTV